MKFLSRNVLLLITLILSGCTVVERHITGDLHSPETIDSKRHVSDGRFAQDRTLVLADIAPVIPAYVERPFDECNKSALLEASKRGSLTADLNVPRSERVYQLKGGVKCVNSIK